MALGKPLSLLLNFSIFGLGAHHLSYRETETIHIVTCYIYGTKANHTDTYKMGFAAHEWLSYNLKYTWHISPDELRLDYLCFPSGEEIWRLN